MFSVRLQEQEARDMEASYQRELAKKGITKEDIEREEREEDLRREKEELENVKLVVDFCNKFGKFPELFEMIPHHTKNCRDQMDKKITDGANSGCIRCLLNKVHMENYVVTEKDMKMYAGFVVGSREFYYSKKLIENAKNK